MSARYICFATIEFETTISPASAAYNADGGFGSVAVTTVGEHSWIATSKNDWIRVIGGTSGMGNGIVKYGVGANTSENSRTGAIIIAGKVFTITQGGTGDGSNGDSSGEGSGCSINTLIH